MTIFIISLIIIWLIGWIRQWAFLDAQFKKLEGDKIFDSNSNFIAIKNHPMILPFILLFTWPYFYFYWKY